MNNELPKKLRYYPYNNSFGTYYGVCDADEFCRTGDPAKAWATGILTEDFARRFVEIYNKANEVEVDCD